MRVTFVLAKKDNALLLKKAFEFKSRFLLWAILRYKLGSNNIARRRILQAAIFNLTNKNDKELETESEKFNTCLDIFKVLNLLDETKQSYLEYFEKLEKIKVKINKEQTISYFIKEEANAYKNSILPKYKTNPNYSIYRSSYINPNELKSLKELLSFYTEYLDELVPRAKFEIRRDFEYFTSENSRSHNDKNINSKHRFKPHNIYFIDNTNYNEIKKALQARFNQSISNSENVYKSSDLNGSNYENSNESVKFKQNILVIITQKLKTQIQLTKPKDSYLYLVTVKGNEIDASFCNEIFLDNTEENDESELFMLNLEANEPKISSLHSNNEIDLDKDDKGQFGKEQDKFKYNIDEKNHFCIRQNDELIVKLANYCFYIRQDHNFT